MISKTWVSGSTEHPEPRMLAHAALERLVGPSGIQWVTFELKPLAQFVQVAVSENEFEINVAYSFSDDFRVLFETRGLPVPSGWAVQEFKPRSKGIFSVLGGGSLVFRTRLDDRDQAADFINECFLKLYNAPIDYQLKAHFE